MYNDQNSGLRAPGSSTQPQGSGFTNLDQYMNANKNNQLGNVVTGGIGADLANFNKNLKQSQGQFNTDINKTQQQIGDYTNQYKNIVGGLDTNTGNYNQNPSGYTNQPLVSQNDVSSYNKILNYGYQGPQGLNNANQLNAQAQQTQQLGQLAQSKPGQSELLRRYVNNPQYNSYQQNLDALYLTPYQNQLQQAGAQTRGLVNQTQNALQQAQNTSGVEQQRAKDLTTGAGQALTQDYGNLLNSLTSRAGQYGQQQTADMTALTQALQNRQLTPEQYQKLGLEKGTALYNVDPTQFLNPSAAPTMNSVISNPEAAKINALSQLSGKSLSSFAPQVDLSQAGKYDINKDVGFNLDPFKTATNTAANQYHSALYDPSQNPFYNGPQNSANPGALGGLTLPQAVTSLKQRIDAAAPGQYKTALLQEYLPLQDKLNKLNQQYGANNTLG